MVRGDPALIAAARRQDSQAFGQLYEQYRGPLFGYLRSQFLLSPDDTHDIIQDAFAKAWQAIPNTTPGLNFQAWLYRIAVNITIDLKRHRAVCGMLDGIDAKLMEDMAHRVHHPVTATGESAILRRERQDTAALAIEQVLQATRNPCARTIIALRLQEVSYEEIGKQVGMSTASVKSLIHRFFQKARRTLDQATLNDALAPVE